MTETRYGNKSVISEIREDSDMPYTKDGRRVDLLLNLLAIINRTTSALLFELFITGSGYQVRQQMKTLPLKEQEKMLFDFIGVFNENQAKSFYDIYKKYNKKGKVEFIQDVIDNGFLINIKPMWEDKALFYKCLDVRKKFPFIKEDDVYIKKWGREYKVLTKYFIGEMYIIKLKQSDRRGFSARSTGALDTKSLPTRSMKSKSHLEKRASSCIRFGEFESYNFSIGLVSEDLALFHALYRTSITGRRQLIDLMFSDTDEDGNIIGKIDSSYTSRVAEIFNVVLKSLGIGIHFEDDHEKIYPLNNSIVSSHELNGETFLCTDYQFYIMEQTDEIQKEIMREYPIISLDQLKKLTMDVLKDKKFLMGELKESMTKELEASIQSECEKTYQEYIEELQNQVNSENIPTKETIIDISASID